MKLKISEANHRDITFFLLNRHEFTFCGTLEPKFKAIYQKDGVDGFACFASIDTHGKNIPTRHPNIVNALLLVKASVNFHIKMWAESRAEGTLPLSEFSKKLLLELYNSGSNLDNMIVKHAKEVKTLVWKNKQPVYYNDMQEQYGLPDWVISAVEHQKKHFYK